jgi:hypothetical protein
MQGQKVQRDRQGAHRIVDELLTMRAVKHFAHKHAEGMDDAEIDWPEVTIEWPVKFLEVGSEKILVGQGCLALDRIFVRPDNGE